jgi:acetyltransferase-like isoleucine patch superfamily enzyme
MSVLFRGTLGRVFNVVAPVAYTRGYTRYLRSLGIRIIGAPHYIAGDVYFDGHDYSAISLGDGVVVSREVMFLTHDYSIARGLNAIGEGGWSGTNTPHRVGAIEVGRNCFVGARASLLPGTHIGANCIIGACSVVRGVIPANSIVIGNPARIVANTLEWAREHKRLHDYLP